VLLLGDDVRLAPLYDVASGLADERRTLPGLGSAAMAIGGVRAFGDVSRRHLERFASEARLDPPQLIERMRHLAAIVPDAVSDTLKDPSVWNHTRDLEGRLLDPLATLCARTIRQLDAR
jgi:serine/threonine-protein kinase HipA